MTVLVPTRNMNAHRLISRPEVLLNRVSLAAFMQLNEHAHLFRKFDRTEIMFANHAKVLSKVALSLHLQRVLEILKGNRHHSIRPWEPMQYDGTP